LFSRAALAGWIVTLEKLIDPATSPPLTYCLLTLSYLAPLSCALPNAGVTWNVPAAVSSSTISTVNWIFPDFSIDTFLKSNVVSPPFLIVGVTTI
jgi:hypothetical protein